MFFVIPEFRRAEYPESRRAKQKFYIIQTRCHVKLNAIV